MVASQKLEVELKNQGTLIFEYYTAMSKDKILHFTITCMRPEGIMLWEVSEEERQDLDDLTHV